MIYRDMHMHTNFCDGKDTPEDMVQSAIKKGLKTVGVVCHSYMTFPTDWCVTPDAEKAFKAEMRRLKEKYSDKINVLCGIEQDLCSMYPASGYDYVIGAVHEFQVANEHYSIDHSPEVFFDSVNKCFGGDYYSAAECYYESIVSVVEKTNADIIAHIDLVNKFNEGNKLFDDAHPRYVRAYTQAIKELVKYKKPFEINTGAISRGYRTEPYPSRAILQLIKELGGKFVLSSDAHAKENVAFEFDKWKDLI